MDPREYEDLIGTAAVLIVKYLIAGLRWMKGEGHKDETVDPLMEKVLGAIIPHISERMQFLDRGFSAIAQDDLTTFYRQFQDGAFPAQEDLRSAVKDYFAALRLELTAGQLTMLTPNRATISRHGGPSQCAKVALGRLWQRHWKTIHNWASEWDGLTEEQLNRLSPYGITVTAQEIRDFVSKYLDAAEAFPERITQVLDDIERAGPTATSRGDTPIPRDMMGPKRPIRTVRGPGRPRRSRK